MATKKRLKLIDYDEARKLFDEQFKRVRQLIDAGETHLDNLAEGFHQADGVIWKLPTVDAVEVVHGRWIFKHNPITDPKRYFIRIVCSECDLHTGQVSNYCPNCGAKMDGGNEDGCTWGNAKENGERREGE